ncbi:hypothetical protein [Prevotella sp. Rep29]|uniref:hypothetical protein n=1 Tax=Prevotella sp. Rep29 TaxID=2691580 RepID=UPI001C6DEA0A|nr:hypothetical protein [Prevotella sp. Rep29]QYR09789.1 hypothetical protein GRF55_01045 [Prevotella sp. Rep29]
MKVKYLKPESSVLPMQTESYLAGTKNQGASTETPTEGGGIGGKEEPAKSTVWNDDDLDNRLNEWEDWNKM